MATGSARDCRRSCARRSSAGDITPLMTVEDGQLGLPTITAAEEEAFNLGLIPLPATGVGGAP